jgi:hypothetical protein
MAKKGRSSSSFNNLLMVGGLVIGGYFAYQTNILGIRDMIDNLSFDMDDTLGSISNAIKPTGSKYPFPYPYPPTTGPLTQPPTTLPAAHYQMAGAPNLGVMGAGLMPNPTLWWDKGAMTPNRVALPSAINYGPYKFEAPIFSSQHYPIQGTNISYPFIKPPFCPPDQFSGQDGRCYPRPLYPNIY